MWYNIRFTCIQLLRFVNSKHGKVCTCPYDLATYQDRSFRDLLNYIILLVQSAHLSLFRDVEWSCYLFHKDIDLFMYLTLRYRTITQYVTLMNYTFSIAVLIWLVDSVAIIKSFFLFTLWLYQLYTQFLIKP